MQNRQEREYEKPRTKKASAIDPLVLFPKNWI